MCKKWMEKCIKKMVWYDVSLLKASVFFFTLFLVTVWAGFRSFVLGIHWGWFLLLGIVFAAPLCKKMFGK